MSKTAKTLVFGLITTACFSFACVQGSADNVFVLNYADGVADTIQEFNSSVSRYTFATDASGLASPFGIASDNYGNLYVANYGNDTIEEFSPEGQGSLFANLSGYAYYPFALAVNSQGDVFASTAGGPGGAASAILEIAPNGNISTFATTTNADGFGPLAFDSAGNLYTSTGLYTIVKFNTNGVESVFADSFLYNPGGLAFDKSGNLYVMNYGDGAIARFDQSGNGSVFFMTNALILAIGLAIDSNGNLYVADHGNGDLIKVSPSAQYSVVASDLSNPVDVTVTVPEPEPCGLVGLAAGAMLAMTRGRRRCCKQGESAETVSTFWRCRSAS
ncbi:MAG: NHL repeat-containing protein [Verrucomicrobiia bacterium]|jgi:sugar lactone lactonase YvrE